MGEIVFDNIIFDSWLTKKSEEILSKVDRETISTEEMLILILKAQTNHFYHMDIEFHGNFTETDKKVSEFSIEIKKDFSAHIEEISREFKAFRTEMKDEFKSFRTEMNDGFDKVWKFQMWNGGMIMALFAGLYLKIFLG